MSEKIISFGASECGPLHQSENKPNEDAWLRFSGSFGELIVVCDGMGSKQHAHIGSKTACLAVKESVVRWSKVSGAPVSYLLHLIEVTWRLRLYPIKPETAATTCLFVVISNSGKWTLGGLGDGLVIVKTGSELQVIHGDRENAFSNQTNGLGISKGLASWSILELPPTDEPRTALLATDGISDDLIAEKYDSFIDWVIDDFVELDPYKRWRQLSNELKNWPTPKHLDDKTLAVIHTSKNPKSL